MIKAGDVTGGAAFLHAITAHDPANAEAWLALGIIATRQKRWSAAHRSFQTAQILRHPQAAHILEWLQQHAVRQNEG